MIEYLLIAALGWLTYDQAQEIGEISHANKVLSQKVIDDKSIIDQCYTDAISNDQQAKKYIESIRHLSKESSDQRIQIEGLADSASVRDFYNCRIPDDLADIL